MTVHFDIAQLDGLVRPLREKQKDIQKTSHQIKFDQGSGRILRLLVWRISVASTRGYWPVVQALQRTYLRCVVDRLNGWLRHCIPRSVPWKPLTG